MKRATLTIIAFLFTIISFAQKKCTIKGELINRDSKVLLIRKCSDGFRYFLNNPTKVPINNGQFEYSFSFEEPEAYQLIFEDEMEEGSWVPIVFFASEGIVTLKLHPKNDHEKNIVTGGELNAEYAAYLASNKKIFEIRKRELMKILGELNRSNEFNSDGYEALRTKLRSIPSDDHDAKVPVFREMDEMEKTHARYTEKGKQQFVDPYDSLTAAELEWKYEYITNNISLASYYLVWKDVEMQMKNNPQMARLVTNVFPLYQKKYPGYVYTKLIGAQVQGLQTINIGNRFIDFKAPTLAGDTVQLSRAIQNKVALINFWGSWCGPCIAKTRLVAPVYEQYKNKGFSIVGIAREFKSTDAVKKRLEEEHFPWTNLVELDDKQNIWAQYGISNGTGMMVLVDNDGKILALDPKPGELESILKKKFSAN